MCISYVALVSDKKLVTRNDSGKPAFFLLRGGLCSCLNGKATWMYKQLPTNLGLNRRQHKDTDSLCESLGFLNDHHQGGVTKHDQSPPLPLPSLPPSLFPFPNAPSPLSLLSEPQHWDIHLTSG
ncbi:hypothetical protein AALO_G00069240 [Alosa alosa]|uniref:Uncharacterized protein n=1 Tax=Alosa alosa TaxID=278164 RepID=A0AAV6H5J0_9TELE|nr:hypothetical protein AALO_G00069240 [Alosa alosa]